MADSLAAARHVHLVGIGGSGMATLGHLLLQMGKSVSGSDLADSTAAERLRRAGATVYLGHAAGHVAGADYVVRSSAVPAATNPEVVEAERLGLPSVKHAEALGELTRGRPTAAVAGTHGKTTTTALIAWLLERGGQDPMALAGGDALNFTSGALLGDGPVVVEADEYDRRFLHLWPDVAVVTSIEADHLDYFADLDEIVAAFQKLVQRLPASGRLVVCLDDARAAALRTLAQRDSYGFAADAAWRATDYEPVRGGGSRFRLHVAGRSWPVESSLLGAHNVANSLAALAVADYFGVGLATAVSQLATFKGTRRRFETKGRPGDVWLVDDYAHHPTAVAAVLGAAREHVGPPGAVWAVFQPHSAHRTAALLGEFAGAFEAADHVLVLPIYHPSGREREKDSADAAATTSELVARLAASGHPDTRAVPTFADAEATLLGRVRAGDVVLTMGAGDVTLLADRLLASLGGSGSP